MDVVWDYNVAVDCWCFAILSDVLHMC